MDVEQAINLRSCNLVSLSGILQVCMMEVVLLDARSAWATIDSKVLSGAIFCSGETNFSFRGRFVLPANWCLIGHIHYTPDTSWCHGTALRSGMAFTVLPEGVSDFMLCAGSQISMLLLPLERLQRKFAEHVPHQAEIPARLLSLFNLSSERPLAQDLRAHFERIRQCLSCDHSQARAQVPQGDDIDVLLDSHLLAGLSMRAEDRPQCSHGRRTRYLIVQRAEQFMRANMRQDIYSNEVCHAVGVSERALRYAFDDLLGISPIQYLTMLRLCTACKNLSLSDISRHSVKSVALSCGLWDLSRFAGQYRDLFGELPRDTLMRAPS
jgi:AraC family ethanolamine operon transcriptional activator